MFEHTREIQFLFRGRIVKIGDAPVTQTVLQWLREVEHATGTKEGCGEGDCGACTVVVGSRDDAAPGGVRLEALNSCIQFLPTLDGKALFTIEDLANSTHLHPLQEAMQEKHGSQCGFCTPGIVMSLWADYEGREVAPSREEANQCLSGNLCRCTGYRPIVDAAVSAWEKPRESLNRESVRELLDSMADTPPLVYKHQGIHFHAPESIACLSRLCVTYPQAKLLAGATDLGLLVTKQLKDLGGIIIYLGKVAELKAITHTDQFLEIGASVSLTDAFSAMAELSPDWTILCQRFASRSVRNAGTLGGNVANGSPIGDSMPGLIALGAMIILQRGDRLRELALEDFYLGYQRSALESGEFLRSIRVPVRAAGHLFKTWKVSKRKDQDISAVCGAISISRGAEGVVDEARIAFGGMAATPKRARQAELRLIGRPLSSDTLEAAARALTDDFTPLTDLRATAAYRMHVAQNLLRRFWLETSGQNPLRLEDISA